MTTTEIEVKMISNILSTKKIALFSDYSWRKERTVISTVFPLRLTGEVQKILVITDKKAIPDWTEAWDKDGKSVVTIDGSPEQRTQKLSEPSTMFHVISKNFLAWLIETEHAFSFDMIVVDGTPGRKSKSWQVLAEICASARRVVVLDNIPNLETLWERVFLLDGGERLESKDFHEYRDRHFQPWKTKDGVVWDWMPLRGSDRWIYGKIKDVCIRVPRATGEGGEVV